MELDKVQGKTKLWPRFVISEDEIERARRGFETRGQQALGEKILLPLHPIAGTVDRITPRERARLVVQGNVAFAESFRGVEGSAEVTSTLCQAFETIESGIRALDEADRMIATTTNQQVL